MNELLNRWINGWIVEWLVLSSKTSHAAAIAMQQLHLQLFCMSVCMCNMNYFSTIYIPQHQYSHHVDHSAYDYCKNEYYLVVLCDVLLKRVKL